MNSCFHGNAVLRPNEWLNPGENVNKAKSMLPLVEGQIMASIPDNRKKYCLHELNRSALRQEAPYEVKKPKKKKKTIFAEVAVLEYGPGHRNMKHATVPLFRKRNFRLKKDDLKM